MDDRPVWRLTVILQATDAQAEEAADVVALALCPDQLHDGPCETPWFLIQSRLDEIDDADEAAEARDLIADP